MSNPKDILGFLKVEDVDVEEAFNSLSEPVYNDTGVGIVSGDQEDPLSSKRNFVEEFNEIGFLSINGNGDDEKNVDKFIAEIPVKKGPGRPKKMRLSSDSIKARNGHCWFTARSSSNHNEVEVIKQKCKGPARELKDPSEAWGLLVDEPILMEILKATNNVIKSRRRTNAYEKCLQLGELRAFLGLCYLCGIYQHTPSLCGPLEELWTLELGNTIFRATISKKRFEFLSESLCFRVDQTLTRRTLAPIEGIWNKFMINCRSYYAPSTHCIIDEHIVPTTDRTCPFQYKLNPGDMERGIRLITLSDAKTLYISNVLIADSTEPKLTDVLNLVGDIKSTHRNVILSKRYTTLALVQRLGDFDLTAVGALPLDSEDIPSDFANSSHSRLHSDKVTLIKGDKQALLASTPAKLNVPELYECTQLNGQRSHKLAVTYSTSNSIFPGTQRWPLQLFHVLLDYAALNAWVLLRLSENANCNITQRDFQRMLGLHLTMPHLRERLHRTNNKLTINLKLQICEMLGESADKVLYEANSKALITAKHGTINEENLKAPTNITLVSKHNTIRSRCKSCPKPNQNKTRMRCQQCARVMCTRHLVFRCGECTGCTIPESLDTEDSFLE